MLDHPSPASNTSQRLQAVDAAIAALRRGMPATLSAAIPLSVLAVETADEVGLALQRRLATGPAVLLLAQSRAADILPGPLPPGRVVALETAGLDLPALQALADPTHRQAALQPRFAELPAGADAALAMTVLGRLLPAVLAAPALHRPGVPIADILDYAALSASSIVRVSEAAVPLQDVADARLIAFRTANSGVEQYAVLVGRPEQADAPLVRVHSECFTGDLLGSLRCDCGTQLRGAIRRMAAEGAGAILYMAQEGRGIGLANKLRAYTLQDRGLDTLDANRALGFAPDERDFLTAGERCCASWGFAASAC